MKICPRCGFTSFIVTVRTVEDQYGDDDDAWECNRCHLRATGKEFDTDNELSKKFFRDIIWEALYDTTRVCSTS